MDWSHSNRIRRFCWFNRWNGNEYLIFDVYMWGVREKKLEQKFFLGEKNAHKNSNRIFYFMVQCFCMLTSFRFTIIKTNNMHTYRFIFIQSPDDTFFIWTTPWDSGQTTGTLSQHAYSRLLLNSTKTYR